MTLKDYIDRDQLFYAGCAAQDEGQCQHPATWRTQVEDYTWRFEAALPVARIRSAYAGKEWSPAAAAEWLAKEARLYNEARSEGPTTGERYYREMEDWWLSRRDEPITVSLEEDGFYWIWGGYHRYAISVAHGLESVPAIVGVRGRGIQPRVGMECQDGRSR